MKQDSNNVVSFRVADAIFPRRMYIFCHGEMSFKTVLMAKYKGKYALFLPKLSTHISSKNIAFLPVAIMTRDVYRCIQSQKSGIWLHHVCTGCIIRWRFRRCTLTLATKGLPSRTAKSTISKICNTKWFSYDTTWRGRCDPRVTLVSARDYLLIGQAFRFKRKLYLHSIILLTAFGTPRPIPWIRF